jgi:hypothetical protein
MVGEPSELVVGQRTAQLHGINPSVTVNIERIKHLLPVLLATSAKTWGDHAVHTFM